MISFVLPELTLYLIKRFVIRLKPSSESAYLTKKVVVGEIGETTSGRNGGGRCRTTLLACAIGVDNALGLDSIGAIDISPTAQVFDRVRDGGERGLQSGQSNANIL